MDENFNINKFHDATTAEKLGIASGLTRVHPWVWKKSWPLGARLLQFAPAWSWCQDPVVSEGYQISFHPSPPFSCRPVPFHLPVND